MMPIKKILLLDPPFFRFLHEAQKGVPLGIAYLAGALRKHGFRDVVVYNADLDPYQKLGVCNRGYYDEMSHFDAYLKDVMNDRHPIYQEVIATIIDHKPDFIGISVRTAKFFITKTLIRLIREALGPVPIAVGGPHASANPDHVLLRSDADFVVRGEGEETIVELVQALNQVGPSWRSQVAAGTVRVDRQLPLIHEKIKGTTFLAKVNGLTYRERGQIIHNEDRPFVENLDDIPPPEKDLILHSHIMTPNDFSVFFSSRGCPYACTFCDSRTTWSRRVRQHSPERIVDEMIAVKEKYGSAFFAFYDDIFVLDPKHTLAFCEELRRRGLADLPKTEFRWWCEVHPQCVSEKVIEEMKAANCVAVAIGGESGNQRTLTQIQKASSENHIREAARVIRQAGLSLSIFFMIGFPWETEEDIRETLAFMEELEPDNPTVSVLTPLPGTAIYDYCRQRNLIQYDDDFLTLFHQRSSHFHSEVLNDDQSRLLIEESMRRCADLAGRKRRERIQRFVRERVIPELQEHDGLGVDVSEQDNHELTAWSINGASARVHMAVDQNYTDEKIFVNVGGGHGSSRLSQSLIEKVGTMLLQEFPQYREVEIRENLCAEQLVHSVLSKEAEEAEQRVCQI